MKKSMLVLFSLVLVITLFSSCEQSLYQQKRLIVNNESDVIISGISLTFIDSSPTISRDIAPTPLISPTESKEYSLPYINNGGRSHQWRIMLQAYDEETYDYVTGKTINFTFNTASSGDIILTFDEATTAGEYTFEGSGSGFQEFTEIIY